MELTNAEPMVTLMAAAYPLIYRISTRMSLDLPVTNMISAMPV